MICNKNLTSLLSKFLVKKQSFPLLIGYNKISYFGVLYKEAFFGDRRPVARRMKSVEITCFSKQKEGPSAAKHTLISLS